MCGRVFQAHFRHEMTGACLNMLEFRQLPFEVEHAFTVPNKMYRSTIHNLILLRRLSRPISVVQIKTVSFNACLDRQICCHNIKLRATNIQSMLLVDFLVVLTSKHVAEGTDAAQT